MSPLSCPCSTDKLSMWTCFSPRASCVSRHGISQRRSQWYDGVPMVTQCSIPPGGTYVYNFTVGRHQLKGSSRSHCFHKVSEYEALVGHFEAELDSFMDTCGLHCEVHLHQSSTWLTNSRNKVGLLIYRVLYLVAL